MLAQGKSSLARHVACSPLLLQQVRRGRGVLPDPLPQCGLVTPDARAAAGPQSRPGELRERAFRDGILWVDCGPGRAGTAHQAWLEERQAKLLADMRRLVRLRGPLFCNKEW